MSLENESVQLLMLLAGTIVLDRLVLSLRSISKNTFNVRVRIGLLFLSILVPAGWLLSDQLTPSIGARIFAVGMGIIWIIGIVPTRRVAPANQPEIELAATPLTKGIMCILLGFTLFVPATFVPLFVLAHFLIRSWFRYISNTELLLPHAISVMLCAYFCVSIFVSISDQALFLGAISITGAHYFLSGTKKITIGWCRANVLANITVGAHTHNNWNMVAKHPKFLHLLYWSGPIAQPLVIMLELAAILSFVNWYMTLVIFLSLIAMHLMIFITTGILFWKWILTLATILIAANTIHLAPLGMSDPLTIILCLTAPFVIFQIPSLAWFDSPVSKNMQFTLCDDEQETTINPYDVAPLDSLLSQARHEFYFADGIQGLDCLGATYCRDAAIALNRLSLAQNVSFEAMKHEAISILTKLEPTQLNTQSVRLETSLLLNQLLYNLDHPKRFNIRNNHIWNAKPSGDYRLMSSLLLSPSCRLNVHRDVYFYSRYHNTSLLLERRTIEIQVSMCQVTGVLQTEIDTES